MCGFFEVNWTYSSCISSVPEFLYGPGGDTGALRSAIRIAEYAGEMSHLGRCTMERRCQYINLQLFPYFRDQLEHQLYEQVHKNLLHHTIIPVDLITVTFDSFSLIQVAHSPAGWCLAWHPCGTLQACKPQALVAGGHRGACGIFWCHSGACKPGGCNKCAEQGYCWDRISSPWPITRHNHSAVSTHVWLSHFQCCCFVFTLWAAHQPTQKLIKH